MKKLIAFFAMVLLMGVAPAFAATYYVDADAADDLGAGTSPAAAWKTVAKVNATSLAAGDTVSFQRGDSWRETLTVPTPGSAGSAITFNAYGTGANPLLIGSDAFSAAGFTLTAAQTNTYEIAMALTPGWVWEDETPLDDTSSIANVEAVAGRWWWDDAVDKLYVHAYDNSNPASNGKAYEKSARDHSITSAVDYVTVDGIDCTRTGGSNSTMGGIRITGDYNTIQNLTTSGHRRHAAGFYAPAIGGLFQNMTIRDSYITTAFAAYNVGTDGNTVRNCDISSVTFPAQSHPIAVHGGAVNTVLEGNAIHGGYTIANVYDSGTNGTIFRRNRIYGAYTQGIYANTAASGTRIEYNVFDASSALGSSILTATAAVGTVVYNNTIYGGAAAVFGITLGAGGTGSLIRNNIISSSKGLSVAADAVTDTVVDYNIYQTTGSGTLYSWNGSNYTTFAAYAAASSQDAHGIAADPMFIGASTGDFRLLYASPARDAGIDVGLTSDYLGRFVYVGSAPDIGAYEYPKIGEQGSGEWNDGTPWHKKGWR